MLQQRLAVIPARGGSKRVPGKNVRLLDGRPLVAHVIEAALGSTLFDRVVVSTDSPEIARVALEHGAEVPFVRPTTLADDVTPVSAATADALARLDPDGVRYAAVCQLMANCPLVRAADVRDSYRQFEASGAEAQVSVVRFGFQNPWWAMQRAENFELEPLHPDRLQQRSQDLPELFAPTGAVWWAKADVLRREGTFHVPHRTGWALAWERAIDVDTEEDFELLEVVHELLRRRAAAADAP